MTYTGEFAPILGPCRCQGCGETLWYARRQSRRMGITVPRIAWRDEDGLIHYCPNLPGRLALARTRVRAKWDNGAVGSSDESNRLANGTRASATTGGAGVVSSIEVVARMTDVR